MFLCAFPLHEILPIRVVNELGVCKEAVLPCFALSSIVKPIYLTGFLTLIPSWSQTRVLGSIWNSILVLTWQHYLLEVFEGWGGGFDFYESKRHEA